MFVHRIVSRTFTQAKVMELKMDKPHQQKFLKKYFDGDSSKVQREMKEIAKKYSLGKRGIQSLFKLKPQVFIQNSPERKQIQDKIIFLNKLEQTQPIARLLNELLFDSKHLLLSMSHNNIFTFIQHLKSFGFDEKSANSIFGANSNLIHNKFDLIYQQKSAIFKDYLRMTDQQILQLFVHEPFFLTCSSSLLRQSVVFFIQKQGKYLTKEQIVKLIRDIGQIFLMGRRPLSLLVKNFHQWGFEKQELWNILLEHPLLLLNHPWQIFDFKRKMFKKFSFTLPMGQLLLRQYPSALICSVRSLQGKLLTARDRLKVTLSQHNLEYLTFKFNANIRPRSEMLIRAKIPYTSEDIVEYLNCSDKQFVRKTGIPEQKLREEKYMYPITSELDFPQKKCLQNYPTDKKIFQMSKRYYPEADLIRQKKGKQ